MIFLGLKNLKTALMMKNKTYRITIAQGEAERLWELYSITKPDELCLEDLAFERGVLVTEGALEGMEACLIRNGNHGLIRVRKDIPEKGRKRFAIAHELGHWELHKDISQIFACTEKDFVAKYKGSLEEIEANYFAAALLMPTKFFEASMEDLPMSLETIDKLRAFFLNIFNGQSYLINGTQQNLFCHVLSGTRQDKVVARQS